MRYVNQYFNHTTTKKINQQFISYLLIDNLQR